MSLCLGTCMYLRTMILSRIFHLWAEIKLHIPLLVLSDDEDEELIKKARKRKKKSNEAEENPERLARTVFVGNLPIEFTRKVSEPNNNTICIMDSSLYLNSSLGPAS